MNELSTKEKTLAYWQSLSDEWLASNESQQVFCQRKSINYSQFVVWRSRLLKEAGKSRPQLAAVKLKEPPQQLGAIKLALPNGMTLYFPPATPQQTITTMIKGALEAC